ncbi:MAG: hypothetical protein IJ956_02135 [Akkermansia sp.]|nr:hypothetical protein [Akkermansia sp.]
MEQVFNRTVSDALFALAERTPYLASAEVRLFFRIDSAGCAFSTEAQAGFSFLCALDIASPYFEAMTATADDLVNKGVARELAWQLSVKNCYNEQAKLPLPNYFEQLPQGYWEHLLDAAMNALMDYLLQPQAELSATCTRAHAEQIDALITNLAKVTLHTPPHAVVYRCTLFTAADADGQSDNTDDWEQANELELLAEEPYATFLHRDTAADLHNILAAAGLNPAITVQYEDCNGKAVMINI